MLIEKILKIAVKEFLIVPCGL